jgi:archaellum component FlaC
MNPNAEPFVMKKPIDVANDEIKALKKTILGLKSEVVLLKSQLKPVRDEYLKRMAEEAEKEKEMVVVSKGWFY